MALTPQSIVRARKRIAPYITNTPILESGLLNDWLGHRVLFKAEGFQKIGAFKVRGALNTLLKLKENKALPEHVVAFSSGNHSQAVAYAAKLLGIKATIAMPSFTSSVKQQATRSYGAEVITTKTRQEAEAAMHYYIDEGAYFIHPYDHDDVIAGQGTACLEALKAGIKPHAIFASCGGGGWLCGSYLAAQKFDPSIQVYGAEPKSANDAAQSLRKGKIVALKDTPKTIADGVRTLAISERTFAIMQQLAGIIEVAENDIIYWTQWLTHLLKHTVEPSSALAMAGAAEWLAEQAEPKTILVLLSGGNISPETHQKIWQKNHLETPPMLKA